MVHDISQLLLPPLHRSVSPMRSRPHSSAQFRTPTHLPLYPQRLFQRLPQLRHYENGLFIFALLLDLLLRRDGLEPVASLAFLLFLAHCPAKWNYRTDDHEPVCR